MSKNVFRQQWEKYYGLKYTELIADLVATVQLQHEEIENLKEKVESL